MQFKTALEIAENSKHADPKALQIVRFLARQRKSQKNASDVFYRKFNMSIWSATNLVYRNFGFHLKEVKSPTNGNAVVYIGFERLEVEY